MESFDEYLRGFLERYEKIKAECDDGSFSKEVDDKIRSMVSELLTEDVPIKTIQ